MNTWAENGLGSTEHAFKNIEGYDINKINKKYTDELQILIFKSIMNKNGSITFEFCGV